MCIYLLTFKTVSTDDYWRYFPRMYPIFAPTPPATPFPPPPYTLPGGFTTDNPIVVDFPLRGQWFAPNTPGKRVPSHGTDVLGERYAYDFMGLAPDLTKMKYFRQSVLCYFLLGARLSDYYGWGQPIYSATDGVVVTAADGCPERDPVLLRDLGVLLPRVRGVSGRRLAYRPRRHPRADRAHPEITPPPAPPLKGEGKIYLFLMGVRCLAAHAHQKKKIPLPLGRGAGGMGENRVKGTNYSPLTYFPNHSIMALLAYCRITGRPLIDPPCGLPGKRTISVIQP